MDADDADRDVPFRVKPLPILVVIVLGLGLPYLAAYAAIACHALLHTPSHHGPTLPWLYMHHLFQLLVALIAIAVLQWLRPFDAGLRLPPGKSYVGAAIAWGLAFGVIMTVVDYAPDLLARRPPDLGFPLTRGNVIGWLLFEGVYVGPTEEILFRSLLVGYLIAAMPGTFRCGPFRMSWAGVIVAAIFALAHIDNLISHPSWAAAGQQVYAFALGVLYAYWLEKSRSVLAAIVGHNAGDVGEYAIVFALHALWR
jgi:hypothetical protein